MNAIQVFIEAHPAFLYGLLVYLAAVGALEGHLVLFLPLLLAIYFFRGPRLLIASLFGIASFLYISQHVVLPPKEFQEIPGTALIEISDISSDMRYGRTFLRMNVQIKEFQPECGGFIVTNVPARLIWNQKSVRPYGGVLYSVRGALRQQPEGFSFKPASDTDWSVQDHVFSFTELRYFLKGRLKCFLARFIEPGNARSFLEGVLLGEFHDPHLKACLKRFGLQHIVVVSGFHFSLIIALFLALFRLLFSRTVTLLLLLGIATFFFLFIGPTASVFRAYIAALLVLSASLFEKSCTGINALGLGLILVVLVDPLASSSLSFQLSFLATWAILLLHPLCKTLLLKGMPSYNKEAISRFTLMEQAIFVLSSFVLTSLSLVIAVTLLMLPISLYAFSSFPLLGLLYNSFFPFIVSIAVAFVIVGMLFWMIPPVCALLCSCGVLITDGALTLVHSAPAWLDVTLYWEGMSVWLLVAYLCCISLVAIACTTSVAFQLYDR